MTRCRLLVMFLNLHLLHPQLGRYLNPRDNKFIWK